MASILADWYGRNDAPAALMNYLPGSRPVSELVDSAAESLFPRNMFVLFRIRSAWPDIVGAIAAAKTFPAFLNDATLKVEVAHPAYLMSLDSRRAKDAIVLRINSMFDSLVCSGVVFVPAASNRSRRRGRGPADG